MRWLVLTIVPLVLGTTGCASGPQPAARDAAERFQAAVGQRDDASACALLAEEARSSLESASTEPCAQALQALDLPGGAVRSVAVWGENAQVQLGSGALFLARFSDGWRVTAAGCQRRQQMPYDCDVEA